MREPLATVGWAEATERALSEVALPRRSRRLNCLMNELLAIDRTSKSGWTKSRSYTLVLEDLLTAIGAVVVALGGGSVVILGLSSWIGKILINRHVEKLKQEIQQEMESYRTKLKKSEFLFQEEFEAASKFISLHRSFLPSYEHPNMELHDACEHVALHLGRVEERLTQYRATHGVALQESVLNRLDEAIDAAGSGKFAVTSLEHIPIDDAEKVMGALQDIESALRDAVWSQSST